MSRTDRFGSEVVIANGVEFNVWRELNTFITWGHMMMTDDSVRFVESNLIAYQDKSFKLDYVNRNIILDSQDQTGVPDSLVQMLKQVADGAVNQKSILDSQTRH